MKLDKTQARRYQESSDFTALMSMAAAFGLATFAGIPGMVLAVPLTVFAAYAKAKADAFGEVADDPPRLDFHKLTLFKPIGFGQVSVRTDFEQTLHKFLGHEFHFAVALLGLRISLERSQGAEALVKGVTTAADTRQRDEVALMRALQDQAARHNLQVCVDNAIASLELAPSVNIGYYELRQALPQTTKPQQQLTVEDRRQLMLQFVQAHAHALFNDYRLGDVGFADLSPLQSIIEKQEFKTVPDILLDKAWCATTSEFIRSHRKILDEDFA